MATPSDNAGLRDSPGVVAGCCIRGEGSHLVG